jgi:hypothetical protein
MKGRLVAFLKEELQISSDVIMVGLRHCGEDISLLPMILWQYGLVTIEQLSYIWDWLEIPSNQT